MISYPHCAYCGAWVDPEAPLNLNEYEELTCGGCDEEPEESEDNDIRIDKKREKSAGFAREVLDFYRSLAGADDAATSIQDLIADLMHLCDADGLDFEHCIMWARVHHGAEVSDDE